MNFVQQLEECLRDLAAAARQQRHPGVKEASERAVLKLRSLQSGYVSAVRKASSSGSGSGASAGGRHSSTTAQSQQLQQHPTTAMFQCSDLLHPFLLAANYPNANYQLLEISFRAMRQLMDANAIVPTDSIHILRVYHIQAVVVTAYYQKLYPTTASSTSNTSKHHHTITGSSTTTTHATEDDDDEENDDNDDENDTTTTATDSQSNNDHNSSLPLHSVESSTPAAPDDDAAAATSSSNSNTTASSWSLFSWGSSSTTNTTNVPNGTNTMSAQSSSSTTTTTTKAMIKNAVSSSTGQTGSTSLLTASQMEKLALEILSSLLQLMEHLRSNYPQTLSSSSSSTSIELWTNAVSLACLWFYLPPRHTVQQAAHSTLSQLLSLLYQTTTTTNNTTDNDKKLLLNQTWEDLLALTESDRSSSSSTTATSTGTTSRKNKSSNSTKPIVLQGAFKLCKRSHDTEGGGTKKNPTGGSTNTSIPLPPGPELALELMTQVWKEKLSGHNHWVLSDHLLLKTMGVTMTLLRKVVRLLSVERSVRVVQWTTTLFQSHTRTYPNECRELFGQLLKSIPAATEACRQHHDFEDGYVYYASNDDMTMIAAASSSSPSSNHHHHPDDVVSKRKSSTTTATNDTTARTTVIPPMILWKAAMVLEAMYHILDQDVVELTVLFDDASTIQALTEAMSDFATISTSCRDHILQVVDFVTTSSSTHHHRTNIQPTIFRKIEQGIAVGTNFADPGSITTSSNVTDRNKVSTPPILGETVWLAVQGILRISECVNVSTMPTLHRQLIFDNIFPPSLAVLQHVLKRFIGSEELVQLSLKGYSTLAETCLPNQTNSVERKVLLTSLSKLSLPSWGKHDSSCQLHDHHVRALACLLRIVHSYYDCITTEWEIVLWTFEELSVMDIASPLLSDEMYHVSLAIAALYERFAAFSTCLSDTSLTHMTAALTEICQATMAKRDMVGDSETILPERTYSAAASDMADKMQMEDRGESTIGGKIMSIGVRALYGSSTGDAARPDDGLPRVERTKNTYFQDYKNDFLTRMTNSKYTIRTHAIGLIPFALVVLSDTAMANMFRSKECNRTITAQLSNLAAVSPIVRPFIMDVSTMLMMSQLSSEELPQMSNGPGKIVFENPMYSQLLAVEPATTPDQGSRPTVVQSEVLAPLCDAINWAEKADVAQASLVALNAILEGTGQNLHGEVWPVMIDAIASLSGDSTYRAGRSSQEWSSCCLMAFRTLKLIVDDFLGHLPCSAGTDDSSNSSAAHTSLLDCCSSFVVSRHDVNTSLTAIGLLWTIADQDGDASTSTDRALAKLALHSSDDRPEVRNAAVHTLFSCIAGRGSGFSPSYWRDCITNTVFVVYDTVANRTGTGSIDTDVNGRTATKHQVRLHHSRDSSEKMWVATQVLVLNGLTRILRVFFTQILYTVESNDKKANRTKEPWWFQLAWEKILTLAMDAASQCGGRESLDIRSVGVELLVLCCQISSKAGIQAAVAPARVGTNMEVVNGALRSVRESQPTKIVRERAHSETTDLARRKLFSVAFGRLEALEQDVLRDRVVEDDTDIQIMSKLCANLARLWDCCQQNEFQVDNKARSLATLIRIASAAPDPLDDDDSMELTFIRIIATVMASSERDAQSRYLNQGQRGSLDLLRTVASQGSSAAYERLVNCASSCFFVRQDTEGEESDHFDETAKHTMTMLNFEAATAVSQEIGKEEVSDECRAFVLFLVLADFFKEHHTAELRHRRYYKRFVPVIRCGVESASKLATRDDDASQQAVSMVWSQVLNCLSQMLTPIPLGKDMIKIPRVAEVAAIVAIAQTHVPDPFATKLSSILSVGASKAFEASEQHAKHAEAHPESDFGRKSKRHRDDLLKLFAVCFSGCCALWPDEPQLLAVAEMVLSAAADGVATTTTGSAMTDHSRHVLCREASLLVCRAFQDHTRLEGLVISVFPSLCRLVLSDNIELKEAAGKVLTHVDIAGTVKMAQAHAQSTEQRAVAAEQRVVELEAKVSDLERDKAQLQKELTVALQPRLGLW